MPRRVSSPIPIPGKQAPDRPRTTRTTAVNLEIKVTFRTSSLHELTCTDSRTPCECTDGDFDEETCTTCIPLTPSVKYDRETGQVNPTTLTELAAMIEGASVVEWAEVRMVRPPILPDPVWKVAAATSGKAGSWRHVP